MRARYEILTADVVEGVVDEAKAVLETMGMTIGDKEAFDRLVATGLPGDPETQKLRFPRERVEEAIASAPSSFDLWDREGEHCATLGGDAVHFVPASSALRILDRETQEVRDARTRDLAEFARLGEGLEHIAYLSTAFVPKDVPQDIADAWRLYVVLASAKKPIVSGAFTPDGVPRMGAILSLFRGGKEGLIEKPLSIFTCCPTTPLLWGEDAARNLVDCADWGIPIEVVPVLLLGMISPVTTVGALVLHTAEVLSGVTIAQSVRPGTPILFGGAPATFHMQLMTNPMTAVEALQVYCGYAQIAKNLGLPCQAYMGLSDSKFNDPQAGAESGIGAFLAAMCGFNSVSGPGMLDYVNCFSLEKLVFDDELAAHALRFVQPVRVKDDLPTRELLSELLEEKHLLTSEHTLEYWPKELYLPGPMVDRTNQEQWQQQGSKDCRERALERIESVLDDSDVDPLSAELDLEIRDLLKRTCLDPDVELPALDA